MNLSFASCCSWSKNNNKKKVRLLRIVPLAMITFFVFYNIFKENRSIIASTITTSNAPFFRNPTSTTTTIKTSAPVETESTIEEERQEDDKQQNKKGKKRTSTVTAAPRGSSYSSFQKYYNTDDDDDDDDDNETSSFPTKNITKPAMVADDINSSSGSAFQNKKIRTWVTATDASAGGDSSDKIFKMPERMTKTCHRWGVVTTIFDPNEAITRVTDMPSWCLVIVPDTKTPLDYMDKLETLLLQQRTTSTTATIMKENIFYFSIDKQKEWEEVEGPFGTFVQLIPWKHFSRKNIGYLFAILHGAKYIFDFDDDNFIKLDEDGKPLQLLPAGDEPTSAMTLKDVNIIMQGANVFNHHPIMGASLDDSWARGFPIEMILNNNTRGQVAFTNDVKFHHHGKEIGVIQFLADGNPDIDALHRLSKPLPMTFPLEGAKSVLVPSHAYAPYNAQATIHTKNAMWAMLLPGTVPGRVSDIWRSYFAQCIFADAGLRLVFSPPKIVQERNDHEYLGDFNAEEDLYVKSGKLVEFLSEWDSDDSETIPKRMKKLWIDLYEYGYIEKDDVYTVQAWLGALEQIGYTFPPLKRRYRNIAVLGQFNYADAPTVVDDVIFWVQKQKESFVTVIAAGPFNNKQMTALNRNFIDAISNKKENRGKSNGGKMRPGFFTPLENLKDIVLRFKGSNKIEGVLYAHDDGILNITELSEGGRYPFPTHNFIATGSVYLYANTPSSKLGRNQKEALKMNAYRIFPDGHFEDFFKKHKYSSFYDLKSGVPLGDWFHRDKAWCIQGQIDLAKDPDSFRYREKDGSILFPPGAQADFFFVPTDYAEEFALATDLHLKHGIFIECAFNAIMHMVWMKTNATVRSVDLCTEFRRKYRGTVPFLSECLDKSRMTPFGFIHPFKIRKNGYKSYDYYYDEAQMME